MTESRRNGLLILFILIGIALIVWPVASRLHSRLEDLNGQISELEQSVSRLAQARQNNEVYLDKWQAINGFQTELIEERQTGFERYLQQLQTQRSFSLATFGTPSVRPVDNYPQFQTLSFALTFYASLEDVVDFVADLDQSERLLRINRLRVTRPGSYYSATRFSGELPGDDQGRSDLSVELVITIPAVAPPESVVR